MNERTRNNLFVTVAMAAITLVPALIVVAVLTGARGPDPADTGASVTQSSVELVDVSTQVPRQPVLAVDSSTAMLQLHQPMMDQMRVSLSPVMDGVMNLDPMWQMMRSPAFIALAEQHEQGIELMLARGG